MSLYSGCSDCYTCACCGFCLAGPHDDDYCRASRKVLISRLFDVDFVYGAHSILRLLRILNVR